MYTPKSVFKSRSGISPGAAIAKSPNVTIIFVDDIVSSPVRNSGSIKMEGNFILRPGAKPIQVYMTPSKQEPSYESDGEEDALSILQKFTGMHPGDELEINELIQHLISRGVILIYGSCQNKVKKVYGTPCAPLQVKPTFIANNDSTGHTLAFEQYAKTSYLPGHYEGELPTGDAFEVVGSDIVVDLTKGMQYKLAPFAVTAAISVENTDLPAGSFVTLIGGGGVDPATLSDGAGTGATILLKDGADWTALEGSSIDLEIFVSGAATYLIERKRS